MGGLLLFVFAAFLLLGVWRIVVVTKSAHGDSQLSPMWGAGSRFSLRRP